MCTAWETDPISEGCGARDSVAASLGVWGDDDAKALDAVTDPGMGSTEESIQDWQSRGAVHGL